MNTITAPEPRADWRLAIPANRRHHLRLWLWSGAALTFLILVIGGITRLTQSGLSIVDWQPIMGVIPPLNAAQWQEAFDAYRASPEYLQLRRGMTMEEFQFIFFWEYIHRIAARLIGLVFIIPFVIFWVKGYLNAPLTRRLLALFGLGALQGLMGWYMVMSGLVDVPHVSHYRLAAHLMIAFAIFGMCLWVAADLGRGRGSPPAGGGRGVVAALLALGALLLLQILWGAFVAGLKAGLLYNTFPLMGSAWIPGNMLSLSPAVANFFENPIAVQWMHRLLGTLLALSAIGVLVWLAVRGASRATLRWGGGFVALLLVQYLLGVMTLLMYVPVWLGVTHQAVAMLLFGVWLLWLHHEREARVAPTMVASGA
jgi:heme a synthase